MNLSTRIERLEKVAGMQHMKLPDVVIVFEEPIQDTEGRMRPGKCCGGIRIVPMVGQQPLDENLTPVGPFKYNGSGSKRR